jgi:hypothetical protein
MNDQSQYLLQSIKGPVIMITIGVLFAADRFTDYHFHQTWPVLLIVIGVMQLLVGRRRRPDYYAPPQAGPAGAPYTPPAPAAPASAEGIKSEEPRS